MGNGVQLPFPYLLAWPRRGISRFQVIRTIILVNIGELFFRAVSVKAGFTMLGKMFTRFRLSSFTDGTLIQFGLDSKDFIIAGIACLMVLAVSILNERGVSIRRVLDQKNTAVRWAAYYAIILFIMIFGGYGMGYLPIDPIYAGF